MSLQNVPRVDASTLDSGKKIKGGKIAVWSPKHLPRVEIPTMLVAKS